MKLETKLKLIKVLDDLRWSEDNLEAWQFETSFFSDSDLFNISDLRYIAHLEFRQKLGMSIGNVYGAFRYYIQDFGISGFIVLIYMNFLKNHSAFILEGFMMLN